jgi:hemoglobin
VDEVVALVAPIKPAMFGPQQEQQASLYDRLGGKDAIKAAVDIFYDEKVLKDPELKPFFEGINMAKQKAMQIQFLSSALGGPIKYMGKDMYTAHKHLIEQRGLNEHHFDLVAGHLVATLKQLGVGQGMVDEVVALVAPIKPAMFGEHKQEEKPVARQAPKQPANVFEYVSESFSSITTSQLLLTAIVVGAVAAGFMWMARGRRSL